MPVKKYQSKHKMFDTSQRLLRIKQFVYKQSKIISQYLVNQSGTKSTKSFCENSFGIKLLRKLRKYGFNSPAEFEYHLSERFRPLDFAIVSFHSPKADILILHIFFQLLSDIPFITNNRKVIPFSH